MTDIDDVRTIISDPPAYARATDVGDGTRDEFLIPNVPIVPASERVFLNNVLQTILTHYTIDYTTGQLIFVTPPVAGEDILITYSWTLLSDVNLTTFLTLESSNIRLAAAMAIDTIASSEALIQKKIQHLDLQTDGPAVARALREHAKALRQQAAEAEEATGDQEGLIDYAEMGIPQYASRDMFWKQWMNEN